MFQKTYYFQSIDELDDILNTISNSEAYNSASGILMQLYNSKTDVDEQAIINIIISQCPKACLTGMTAANIATEEYDISNFPLQLSVTYFKETQLVQFEFDMENTTAFVAGRFMSKALEELENVKCLQILYYANSISINSFVHEFNHHHIPTFGAKAGRNIRVLNPAHIYGKGVYSTGFIVVAFVSTSLKIYMDNNLGWQPIGLEMAITKTSGNSTVVEVDKKPAVDIFSKYLKVSPNNHFVQNVCEFPLIIERNNFKIARVPSGYLQDGSISFTSDVQKGDHFRLSYANPDNLFALTAQSVNDVHNFEPEALFIFECGNRVKFLKDKYLKEIKQYSHYYPELSVTTGYAELFYTDDGFGGDLNSALVAVGFKESDNSTDCIIPCREYIVEESASQDTNVDQEIPFLERILTFLESTSKELDNLNKELGKVAYTDQLTKIYNRWELERKIEEALELTNQGMSYGLFFIDIDHFKHVNDTYGHDVGDSVLLSVVNVIKESLKEGHIFGRWGGEEFVYIIPDADEKTAVEFAESIRKKIDDICFVTVKHITISLGVTLAKPNDTLASFVKRADDAVYEAKENGRNQVKFHLD